MGNRHRARLAVALAFGLLQAGGNAAAQPGPPADPVEQTYLQARALWHGNQLDEAVPVLEGLVADHLDHATAEHSVTLLLDALVRLGDHHRLAEWIDRLAQEQAFLARSPQTAATIEAIRHQLRRKHAERLEALGDYAGCGAAYLALYQAAPSASQADEVAYNAGVCFEEARSIGTATNMYTVVVDRFPASPIARRALVRLASLLDGVAFYERAAPHYETYAARYAGEADAADALLRAIELRAGMGHHREARAATERYVKLFGRKRPAEAAQLWLAALELYDAADVEGRIAHLKRYAKQHARAGTPSERVVAHARLGELLWKKSCSHPDSTGLCLRRVRLTRAQQAVARCGPLPPTRPATRDPKLVREARAALSLAVQSYQRTIEPSPAAVRAQAMARFYLAEPEVEAALALVAPSMKDLDPSSPSQRTMVKAFVDWLRATQDNVVRFGASPDGVYAGVIDAPTAQPWSSAAMLRSGQVRRAFASVVTSIEIPTQITTGPYAAEATKAYCDNLGDQTKPIFEVSEDALEACLAAPLSSDWTRACARELEAWDPTRYPPARERLGRAPPAPLLDRGEALLSASPAAKE